jgi:late competence protein required for DNA uptake (superfamily II DNA/RNA helicase)
MATIEEQLKIPDLWQQKAVRALLDGQDVIVSAPTGAGKTYIFEMLIEGGFQGRAVYTVPTRALANDKRLEWLRKGWSVGITTGDRSSNPGAPVVVATLETQKRQLLRGEGPDLLVIDEYQMIGDEQRGLNYELAIAMAPAHTRLLLLSGSVGNPDQVQQWLQRLGRKAMLIQHRKRPVPLEEIHVEGIPYRIPDSVRGFWPRAIAKALKAGMAPLLAFAPRRKAAEDLAIELARVLPEEDPLVLSREQEQIAGAQLKRLLRNRVAYHHSGLDYAQRAGLIEPLAKAGQLKVVVATMGLAAGINFSMRSVVVTDRQYRTAEGIHEVRPDELLQMFGRAGRRGMDAVGFILLAPGKPRLEEAKPIRLRRSAQVDWPSLIGVMQVAIENNDNPIQAARNLTSRLFSHQRIPLGLSDFHATGPETAPSKPRIIEQSIEEIQTPDGSWERKRGERLAKLDNCLFYHKGVWKPALSIPAMLNSIKAGTLCKLPSPEFHYGRQVPVARFGRDDKEGELVLTRWMMRQLLSGKHRLHKKRQRWTLNAVEKEILPLLPHFTQGGRFLQWREAGDQLYAILHYSDANAYALIDNKGQGLIHPPQRTITHRVDLALPEETKTSTRTISDADTWFTLGLIDKFGAPTRRGILFSFFNYGEGLAIAAALEDESYAIEDLLLDLANLRAGHRFDLLDASSGRFAAACRAAYGMSSYSGYLKNGVPPTYGEGATEILFDKKLHAKAEGSTALRSTGDPSASSNNNRPRAKQQFDGTDLRLGDVQRVRLEWRSLVRHIARSPDLNWERWLQLKALAASTLDTFPKSDQSDNLPPLSQKQSQRHKSFLTFE